MSLKEVIRNDMVEEFLQKEKERIKISYLLSRCFVVPIEYKEKINCLKTIDFVYFPDRTLTFEETKEYIKNKCYEWKLNVEWRLPKENELRAIMKAFNDVQDGDIDKSISDGMWTNKAYRTERGGFCCYAIGMYSEKFREPNEKARVVLIGGLK